MYVVVWKLFLPRITYSIENRKSKIVNDLDEAQKLKEKAEKKLDEYNKIIEQSEKKQCHIVMTEKDYFKVKHFNIQKSGYLEVSLKINDKKDFINILNSIYE